MYVDSHAHLTGEDLFLEAESMISRAQMAGLSHVVNICTDALSLERGLKLAETYSSIKNTGAVTPHDVDLIGERDFPIFAAAARSGRLSAVGESGLDYYNSTADRAVQADFFKRYLQLAQECNLPIVIHCREAFKDLFAILDAHMPSKKGVFHCFTGTLEEAKQVVARGFYVSLSGIVTFKKSLALQEIAKSIPLESLLIETDSPYLAPQTKRGKQNEPAFVVEVAEKIAELKGLTLEQVAQQTTKNALELFR
ncbi:MAG: TatD family hydrolase [Parachlamydiaceae bacterium]